MDNELKKASEEGSEKDPEITEIRRGESEASVVCRWGSTQKRDPPWL